MTGSITGHARLRADLQRVRVLRDGKDGADHEQIWGWHQSPAPVVEEDRILAASPPDRWHTSPPLACLLAHQC